MTSRSLTRLLFAVLLLQSGRARAQAVDPESAAKIGLGGMAAAAAAIVLGHNQNAAVTVTTGTELLPLNPSSSGAGPLSPGGGPLSPGGAAGIASAATSGSSSTSGSAFGYEQLLIAPIGSVIAISTSTTSSTGTTP